MFETDEWRHTSAMGHHHHNHHHVLKLLTFAAIFVHNIHVGNRIGY